MKLKAIFITAGTLLSSSIYAAPNDAFLQASEFKPSESPLRVTLALDAVNDTLDVFDFRESEGVTGTLGDYLGANIQAQYQLNPQWSLEGQYYYRDIDTSPDTNTIHTGLFGVRYTPELNLAKGDSVALRASIWGNRADELKRSPRTMVNQHSFENIVVDQPQDLQLQLDGLFSRKIDHMNQVNGFVSAGYSKVEVDSLNMRARYRGCLADIHVRSNNYYTGHLAEPCVIGGAVVTDLNIEGDATDYGLDMNQDMNYDSFYASFGGSWNWRYQNFESQLAYQYQRLWRDGVDDRVSKQGHTSVEDNHTFGLKLSYDLSPNATAFVKGEVYESNFVGQIPFLYNSTTASNLDRRYGLATVGVTLHGF
jgi:hypothetical protein